MSYTNKKMYVCIDTHYENDEFSDSSAVYVDGAIIGAFCTAFSRAKDPRDIDTVRACKEHRIKFDNDFSRLVDERGEALSSIDDREEAYRRSLD